MRHPFDLKPAELEAIELDFEETLTDEEARQVKGGRGDYPQIKNPRYLGPPIKFPPDCEIDPPYPLPYPIPFDPPIPPTPIPYPIDPLICPIPKDPPMMTTMALGEEGGSTVDLSM
ncbi:MAG TPA: hypothetical protein IGS31_03565 [Oscillatoriales cyanobacterium M4454_W2019_049]|nr:hypothetical protein [Oscillatoriales cyanobacterium M4454_W2019_049]